MIDCHQRVVVEGGIRCLGACGEFAGTGGAMKDATVQTFLLNHQFDLVAT